MKCFDSKPQVVIVIIIAVAGFLHLVEAADEFRRCYNTSVNTHCFEVQINTTNNESSKTFFDNARSRCNDLSSTLPIVKDEETESLIVQFLEDDDNPARHQSIWTDAHRVNDYRDEYTWHWVDATLPAMPVSDGNVSYTLSGDYGQRFVAALEFMDRRFLLMAEQARLYNSYVCEFAASPCSSISPNVRDFNGRCYEAIKEWVNWYEARNRCLQIGGDLASFPNVSSIDFTSWLGSDPNTRYWIGLRLNSFKWIDTGEKVRYANWIENDNDWTLSCLRIWIGFTPSFSWSPVNCNSDDVYVVCHTVTPVVTTTSPMTSTGKSTMQPIVKCTMESTMKSTMESNSSAEDLTTAATFRTAESDARSSCDCTSVGVGLGIPVVILTVLVIVLTAKYMRLSTAETRNKSNELSTVREISVGQINESVKDNFQLSNPHLDDTSGLIT